MKAFHKTLLPIFLSLLLILSSCTLHREKTVFELIGVNPGQITKVVTSGMGNTMRGQSMETTDIETIEALIENFKSVKLTYEKNFGDEIGGHDLVRYTFYNEEKELGYFSFDKQIYEQNVLIQKYRGPFIRESYKIYKVVSGSFDRELMDKVAHAEA